MDVTLDHVMLSRLQFAATAMFHIIWPVLTIGLSIFLLFFEAMWLKTRDEEWLRQFRFWSKLFLLNFTVGAVTGIPLEFQFGTNWGGFAIAGGDVMGHLLGFEAAMAFMLEASFLPIMIFGWKRVPPGIHIFATSMVALGASMSAFWIMDANSWMHTPSGGAMGEGGYHLYSQIEAIFNPDMFWGITHMWTAAMEITVFFIGGVSAWFMIRGRETAFFLRTFRLAAICAVLIAPLQILLGDGSGKSVFEYQPAKLAAIEAHWDTNPPGQSAPWHILAWPDADLEKNRWQIDLPGALSLITTHSLTGQVRGLKEFPPRDRPPIWIPFYAFRLMVGTGFLLVFIMAWTLIEWKKGYLTPERITGRKWLLRGWIAAVPLSYISMEAGWATREVGRQPWMIYGVLRTDESATLLPAGTVGTSLATFGTVYALLFVVFAIFAVRIMRKGPEPIPKS